jgi:dipicolinate synthase subunit A
MRFSVIGGDARQGRLAGLIAADGHDVTVFGVDAPPPSSPVETAADLPRAVLGIDCVVLPIPVVREAGVINAPALRRPHTIEELLAMVRPGQVLVGGRIGRDMRERGWEKGAAVVDLLEREDFALRNAVPTAEGALQLAFENTDITLHDARCLVIGCGRIGKTLALRLAALGAKVTMAARGQTAFAWAEVMGHDCLDTGHLEGALGGFDVVFNTVPALVLPERRLRELPENCLCVDLASTPGGMDFDAAHKLGLNCLWALGLPGRVAPRTAGIILRDTIYHIMNERAVT